MSEEIKNSEEAVKDEKKDEIKVEEGTPEVKTESKNIASDSKETPAAATAPAAPIADRKPAERPSYAGRPTGGRPTGGRPPARRYNNDGKSSRFRRRVCRFCYEKDAILDYNKPEILERFITDRGKILPRRVTGTCSKHQRHLAKSIKRARYLAYLPYLEK